MSLRLSDQLCFPLYAAARAIQQRYRPLLEPLGLTYPQYLVMMVLWERGPRTVSELGAALHLDSGTLTPLLQRLEASGLVRRARGAHDQRVVTASLTEAGDQLRERAADVPARLLSGLPAHPDLDPGQLKATLDALLRALETP
jgi:DNA-binding MarR family transcriptional regulator